MPDNPTIAALRNFYKEYHNGQAPPDADLEGMATRYAGKEKELWKKLYSQYNEGSVPDDATLEGIVKKYPNTIKKKAGGSSGFATTAVTTSSSPIKPSGIPVINENDEFRADMGSYRKAVDENYKRQLNTAAARLEEGKIKQSDYAEISAAADQRRAKELDLISKQEQEGPQPNVIHQGWDQLRENYRPFFPTQRYRTFEEASKHLPDQKVIESFVDYTDDLLASSMGVSREMARAKVKQAYAGGGENSGNSYAQMLKLRKEVIEKNRDKILAKFPDLPASALDVYTTASNFEPDLSDPQNPFSKVKYAMVDQYIDKNYRDLDEDRKQMLRKDLIDEVTNRPVYNKALEKTREQIKEKGLADPAEAMKQYEQKAGDLASQFTESVKTFRNQLEVTAQTGQAKYETDAKAAQEQIQAGLDSRQKALQAQVNDGMISFEAANAELEALKKDGDLQLKNMFDQYSQDLSRQQREIIQEAEKSRATSINALEALRKDLGLEVEDEKIKASSEYVETFSRLFEENVTGIQMDQRLKMQEQYDKLDVGDRIKNAAALGYADMFDSFGGGLKWIGMYEAGNFLTDLAKQSNETIPVDDLGQFDSKDILKASWWIDKGVRMLPTTLSLMATGMGTTGAVTGALARAGMTQVGRTLIGAAAGAMAMRPIEAFMEAGQRFNQDLEEGKDVTEASKNASSVMRGNMALAISDMIQLSFAFGKLPLKVRAGVYGKIAKAGSTLGNGAMNFSLEGGEEVYQGYLQEKPDNPMLSFMEYAQSAQGIEAGVLGGISGLTLAAMSENTSGQATAVHKLLTNYYQNEMKPTQEQKIDGPNLQKRYFQLIDTLKGMREKGVLNEGEFQDALQVAEISHNKVMDSLTGALPLDYNSQAHVEYTALAVEANKIRKRADKEKDPDQKQIYNQAIGAVESRMRELLNDPSSPIYSIDGVPVTEKDFMSLMSNAKVREFTPASKFRAENDLPLLALAAKAMDDKGLALQVADEFIRSTEEVNTIEEGIEYLDKKIGDAANGRNAKDTVDRYTALRDVLISLKDENVRPKNYQQRIESGEFDKQLAELNPDEALVEYQRAVNDLEKEGTPESFIEAFKKDHSILEEKVDRSAPEELLGEEQRYEMLHSKQRDNVSDTFDVRIDDFDLLQKVKQSDPELFDELDQTIKDGKEPTQDQKQRYVDATEDLIVLDQIEDQDKILFEDFEDLLNEPGAIELIRQDDPELVARMEKEAKAGGVTPETARKLVDYQIEESAEVEEFEFEDVEVEEEIALSEREQLQADVARLKDELKDNFKKWFSPKLGLTPFNEQDLMDDIETYRKMVELAYKYIRLGIKDISDFASQIGVAIDDNVRNIWAAAQELNKHRFDSVITMNANLSRFDAFRELIQDKDIAIKNLQAELETLGVNIDDASDFYKKRELVVSKINDAVRRFNEKMIGTPPHLANAAAINAASFVGRIQAAFPDNDSIMDDLSLYMYAKHAIEYNSRVKEMKTQEQEAKLRELEDLRDNASSNQSAAAYQAKIDRINAGNEYIIITNGSGMTDTQAQEIIDWYEIMPDFAEFDAFVQEFRKEVIDARIDLLEQHGLLSPERIKALRDGTKEGSSVVFEHYVPLKVTDEAYYADFDPSHGGLSRAGSLKSIKGTSRFTILDRNNPITQALADYAGTIKEVERNESARALYNLIKAQPDKSFWDVVPSRAIVELDNLGKPESIRDLVSADIKANSTTVMINGKLNYLYFKPMIDKNKNPVQNPVLRAMLSNPLNNYPALNAAINVMRMYISFKRNLITTYNVAFGIPNFARDLEEALGNVETVKQDLKIKHIRGKFMVNLPSAMKAIAKSPWDSSGHMGDMWERAQKAGMKMSWAKYDQSDEQVTKYEEAVKKYHENRGAKGMPLHTLKVIADRVQMLNDIMENTTRLSLFASLVDSGVSDQKAASAAKNITLNFEKKGTVSNITNALWLFANAGIQGVARGSQLVVHRVAGRYVFNKRGLALGGSIAAFSFMNRMLFDLWDDEDKDKFLSDFDFENNTYIFNPIDPSKPLKIPKPYSFIRIFMNVGENAYDAVSGRTPVARAMLGNVIKSVQAFVDPIGGGQPNRISAWTPEVLTIPAEWWMNKKWNGTPFHYKEESDPGSEKYTKQTPPWLIGITDTMNRATDFAHTGEGVISWSPALIQYIGQQFFGGVGAETIRTADLITNAVQGEGIKINDMTVVRRFMTDLDDQQQPVVTKFFALTKRRRLYGISDEEVQTAREAYKLIKENDWLPKQTLGRLRNDFKKKWGVSLK